MRDIKPDLRKAQYVKKVAQVADLKAKLARCRTTVLIEYRGMSVKDTTELRNRLRKVSAELEVSKNTLFRRAIGTSIVGLDPFLEGPTAVVFAFDDSVAAVKTVQDFTRDSKFLILKGGYVEGRVFGADQLREIAKMPPRDQIIGGLLGALQAPAANLVGVLQAPAAQLVFTLAAIADRDSAQAAA